MAFINKNDDEFGDVMAARVNEFIKKVENGKIIDADLSSGEDLSIAVMNLISIEEHLYFSGMKTGKQEYFELLNSVREMRKKLLKELVKEPEGEVWCVSKHLLAASMRLMEVGTKYLSDSKKKEAYEKFYAAFDLYSMFWALNLKIDMAVRPHANLNESTNGLLLRNENWKVRLSGLVKKIIDCCKE